MVKIEAEDDDVVVILRQWEEDHKKPMYNPITTLEQLFHIIEIQTENHPKMDSVDERRPCRIHPECNFTHILEVVLKNDNFMDKLINEYLCDTYWTRECETCRDKRQQNIASFRLMLAILQGLETSVIMQADLDDRIHRIFFWAEECVASILDCISVRERKHDSQLALEALNYLASLLCLEKMSIEFLNMGGLQKLLNVPRLSVAAIEVAQCFYYLAYYENAMEKICMMPERIITELVAYVLWFLETNDSGRDNAIMFFGYSSSFRVILEEFHYQGGLKKLLNIISSTLPIVNIKEELRGEEILNNCDEFTTHQTIRHVAVALKRFIRAHFYFKAEQMARSFANNSEVDSENIRRERETLPLYSNNCSIKAHKLNCEKAQTKVEIVHDLVDDREKWPPLEEFQKHGGITLLLQIIDFAREWNCIGCNHESLSVETIRSCLDVIANCSVYRGILLLICDHIEMPDKSKLMPMNLILSAAKGEIIADPFIQKTALRAIVNCVWVYRHLDIGFRQDLIQKVLESVALNDGIAILWKLMNIKVQSADDIRTLACRALAGLANSKQGSKIIRELHLFTEGQIQDLMKNPILQEKRQEHVIFRKYALKLIERVLLITPTQFHLCEPHKCPNPKTKNSTPINMTVRVARCQCGMDGRMFDRRHIYSRFCPAKTFWPFADEILTSCTFTPCQQYLIVGTQSGDMNIFNTQSGIEDVVIKYPKSHTVNYMECNRKGNLLLSSSFLTDSDSLLWNIEPFIDTKMPFQNLYQFDEVEYAEFSKKQDKIIGTSWENARIYDIATGQILRYFGYHSMRTHHYEENKATFSMNDELVLNDGILWDVNSGKEIHRFEKLNQKLNGVFHPNGKEIVSNTEIWDLRTFHLLKTVPSLEQMEVIFSPVNHIIYAHPIKLYRQTQMTSFKTLDAFDYDIITTNDVKKDIYSLTCNKFDTQIAVVENLREFDNIKESCVRIYDVGRCRYDDEQNSASIDNSADDTENAVASGKKS